ncbi:hypothetical protein TKK_0013091 [Trichogramma kaykai]
MSMYNRYLCADYLKILRQGVNFEIETERCDFLMELIPFFNDWDSELPNFLEIFKPKEIECLLSDSIKRYGGAFVRSVARSGYKDEPKLDTDGKPILLRTTPVHYAARCGYHSILEDLFSIYDRYDVNYTDEFGWTHFQAACAYGCNDVAERFLELGQDPNDLALQSANPLLHMALWHGKKETAELLLRAGADPNLANEDGLTPLHFVAMKIEIYDDGLVTMLSELSLDRYKPVRVNARDNRGQTPLHYAVAGGQKFHIVRALLTSGANPNLADAEGSTAVHLVCKRKFDAAAVAKMLLEFSDNEYQPVQIGARDKLGRTPLQWAVASFEPDTVDELLYYDAELSKFAFPTESHFDECFETHGKYYTSCESEWRRFTLRQLSNLTNIIESLEDKGYEFDEKDIFTIMKIFSKHRWFKETPDLDERLRISKVYMDWAKRFTLNSSLTKLHALMQLPIEEAKKLFTIKDYANVKRSSVWGKLDEELRQACILHLCEILFRRFFRPWVIESFLELTQYQLPILCCEKIFDTLMNEDLWRIYLAGTDQSS